MRFLALLLVGTWVSVAGAKDWDRTEAIRLLCDKAQTCGCPEENCQANMAKATHQPLAALRCAADLACPDLCDAPKDGSKSKSVQMCFDRPAWKAAKKKYPDPGAVSPIRHQTIVETCARAEACGCGEAACVLNMRSAPLPLAAFTCTTRLPCEQLCKFDEDYTKNESYKQCFAPERQKAVKAEQKAIEIANYCQKMTKCGCPEPACVENYTKNTTAFDEDLIVCFNRMSCDMVCEPVAMQNGSKSHVACIQPELDRQKRDQAAELARARSAHRTSMSIIRAIGGSGQRVRVYDSNGNYLRTESR